ncbi:hypothetical protein JYT31_03215, partial [Beggiatoa alba]|nr:hypothetical protein [Beggiatoa alba]
MLRKINKLIIYTLIAIIIFLAIGISVARVVLPAVHSYRSYVEQQLASILEHPVKMGDLDAFISGFTPVLVFYDVKLMSSKKQKELLEISKITIGFSLWRSIKEAEIIPDYYTIEGVELAITRRKDGKILLQDVDVAELGSTLSSQEQPGSNELTEWLFNRSSLIIKDSSIIWHDKEQSSKPTRFVNVSLKLKNILGRHQFNVELELPSEEKRKPRKLSLALDIYGDILDPMKWAGKFYVNGKNINTSEWGFKPIIMDVMAEQAQLDFELWG